MSKRTATPACTCGNGTTAGSHRSSCAVARWALAHARERSNAPGGAPDPIGRRGRFKAKRTEERGITFASGLEALVFRRLCQRREDIPGALLLRQPRFDLWASWTPGMGKPLVFTPDFLLVVPRDVLAMEPEALDDDVGARTGGAWTSRHCALWDIEVHEAKGARGLESRDYVPRLAAFRAAHPRVPVFVWRAAGAAADPTRLADLEQGGARG